MNVRVKKVYVYKMHLVKFASKGSRDHPVLAPHGGVTKENAASEWWAKGSIIQAGPPMESEVEV